ncbi:MAG: TatD family hydrolase [Candidatus Diapherotrites archaeon]
MHLIDSHCHLNELSRMREIEETIKKAEENNVKTIISNSVDLNSMKKNIELQEKFSSVKCALGIHPSNILKMNEKEINEGIKFIEKNISKAIALGEIGLDFRHAETQEQKEKQRRIFQELIELGNKKRKALIVHSRYAGKNCLEMLEEKKSEKVLMHWFTNSIKEIQKAVELNYFISVGPSILNSIETQKIVKEIPMEFLLLETDCPVKFNGIPSEPFWIKEVAEKLSELKEISVEELTEQAFKNAVNFFETGLK